MNIFISAHAYYFARSRNGIRHNIRRFFWMRSAFSDALLMTSLACIVQGNEMDEVMIVVVL